jgi:hypothetical protein
MPPGQGHVTLAAREMAVKRSGMAPRKTPLRLRSNLPRNPARNHAQTPRSSAKAARSVAKPTRRRRDDIPPEVREQVYARFDGLCAGCGRPLRAGWRSVQHRRRRQAGGTRKADRHDIRLLVAVCGINPATGGCHRQADEGTDRHARGLQLRQHQDPSTPLTLWDGRRVVLTDDGGYRQLDAGGLAA